MQVVLIMFRTGGEHRSFSVSRSTTTIGRREDCDLRIPVGDVSRKHCRLVLSADNLRLQDLGSSNGTFVNGQRISDTFLNPGDAVAVGPVQFVVQIDGVPAEDQVVAPAPLAAGESTAGGTGLAAEALAASQAEPPDAGVIEDAGLLEEVPAESASADDLVIDDVPTEDADLTDDLAIGGAAEPASAEGATIDELPAGQDAAFDLTTDHEPSPAEPAEVAAVPAPAADEGEWDFLIEDTEAEQAHHDVHVDLDATHGSNPHA
jgi:predicted component of type VI protein secretion system